ncbi:uncharacterized protein TrAFT101_003410 [Trichoderma asperellum]|uniref:uncharacterized protein n=1 Tax=Trichoderma asperellum TaxID=101201 RepID=UPI00332430A8|nr:hypothetical protein TrAFT101_003410 [Trichoderma asperellum]
MYLRNQGVELELEQKLELEGDWMLMLTGTRPQTRGFEAEMEIERRARGAGPSPNLRLASPSLSQAFPKVWQMGAPSSQKTNLSLSSDPSTVRRSSAFSACVAVCSRYHRGPRPSRRATQMGWA